MSEREIGVEEARKVLGNLANDAGLDGTITYLTRHRRRIAAIVPLDLVKETAVPSLVLDVDAEPGTLEGYFADHKVPNWNWGPGEGWPTSVYGSREQLRALKDDLDRAGYTTNLHTRRA